MKTYKIVRMFFDDDKENETIKTGLTFEEAKEHCRRNDTSGLEEGEEKKKTFRWFDGYTED